MVQWYQLTQSKLNVKSAALSITFNTRKPWLSQSLTDAIKTKNKLYVKLIKFYTTASEVTYKIYRYKLSHILKYAEGKHFKIFWNKNK